MKKILLTTLCTTLIILVVYSQKLDNNNSSNGPDTTTESQTKHDEKVKETSNKQVDKEILEIRDKMFIGQCNDIYLNPKDYESKMIKLEGIYDEFTDTELGETYHYVIRYGPGCCGNDGVAGFEFSYDGEMPKLNDWIEVIGTIKIVDENTEYPHVVLQLSKITVLDERGEEYVED